MEFLVIFSNNVEFGVSGNCTWKCIAWNLNVCTIFFFRFSFMPPDDPLGRNGPTLEQFLRKKAKVSTQQPCPYGKKCTYGNKCKYWHPDRANNQKSVIEQLQANSSQRISDWAKNSRDSSPGKNISLSGAKEAEGRLSQSSFKNYFCQVGSF